MPVDKKALTKTSVSLVGFYLLAEATGFGEGDIARVYSPVTSISSVHCLSLYYTLFGRDIDKFTVYKFFGDNLVRTLGE